MSKRLLTPVAVEFDGPRTESNTGTYVFIDDDGDVTTVTETQGAQFTNEETRSYVRAIVGNSGLIEAPEPDKFPRDDEVTALFKRVFEQTGIILDLPQEAR
jgi:uncharacterized OB-fold protein